MCCMYFTCLFSHYAYLALYQGFELNFFVHCIVIIKIYSDLLNDIFLSFFLCKANHNIWKNPFSCIIQELPQFHVHLGISSNVGWLSWHPTWIHCGSGTSKRDLVAPKSFHLFPLTLTVYPALVSLLDLLKSANACCLSCWQLVKAKTSRLPSQFVQWLQLD